ncbi:uncharacterized protein LOC119682505 [Teleopsis dalmanni]|uniref:uncharacterized protein LOC119682505 n=1 Tax=Teleopsis dalmanni TaxID=139649 RepID=UPI0018CE2107|nr:uncharacterized protein LOC119682505 [Teleopsis dalmanni]
MPDIEECYNQNKLNLRKVLDALVCQDYDVHRLNGDLINLRKELQKRVEQIVESAQATRTDAISCIEPNDEFESQMRALNEVIECSRKRMEKLQEARESILACAENCVKELLALKIKLKKSYAETLECLKCNAVMATEVEKICSYKRRVSALEISFDEEVNFTKSVEYRLRSFFEELAKRDVPVFCEEDPFDLFDWMPPVKDEIWLQEMIAEMKEVMGRTMINALAEMHMLRPSDPLKFLAMYFYHECSKKKEEEDIPKCD